MIRRAVLLSFLVLAGCGGTSTVGTTGGGHSGSTSGSNGATTGTCIAAGQPDNGDPSSCCSGQAEPGSGTCEATSNAGSTGGCRQNGAYDFGDASACCSGQADQSGICQAASTAGSGGTTGTPGTTATGTTTGGTCPQNMPDISSGAASVVSGTCTGELGSCPQGFTCISGQCILNGGNGGLQVTLSFDDPEDFDIHVVEPNGHVVWYGNTNRPPGSASSSVTGSLDRDSNAGCTDGTQGDGVNIENVIYPSDGGIPSGTYKVYVDYWKNCDGASVSNVGVQVRRNGAIYKYCGQLSGSGDRCQTGVCGTLVNSFTYP